jgi:hypothetical protein
VVDVVDPAATKVVVVVAVVGGEEIGVRDGSTVSFGRASAGEVTGVTSRESGVVGAVGCGVPRGARGRGPGVEVVLDVTTIAFASPAEFSLLPLIIHPTSTAHATKTPPITRLLTWLKNDVRFCITPRTTCLYQ